jgi:serine/threonine-protein kinase
MGDQDLGTEGTSGADQAPTGSWRDRVPTVELNTPAADPAAASDATASDESALPQDVQAPGPVAAAATVAPKPRRGFWPWAKRDKKTQVAGGESAGDAPASAPAPGSSPDEAAAPAGPIFGSQLGDDDEWPPLPTDQSFDEVVASYTEPHEPTAMPAPDRYIDDSSLTIQMEPIRVDEPAQPIVAVPAVEAIATEPPERPLVDELPERTPAEEAMPQPAALDLPEQVPAGRPGPMLYSFADVADSLQEQAAAARVTSQPASADLAAGALGVAAATEAVSTASRMEPGVDASAMTVALDPRLLGQSGAGTVAEPASSAAAAAAAGAAAGSSARSASSLAPAMPPPVAPEAASVAPPAGDVFGNPLRARLERGQPTEIIAAPPTPARLAPIERQSAPIGGDFGGAGARLIGGRFRAVERLDRGGAAETYKVVDEQGIIYAVDLLHPGSDREIQHLRDSMLAVAALQTPNVARVYEWGTDEAGFYVVREFVDGWDLETLLTRGPLDALRVSRYGAEAALGLAAAHAAGIVHGSLRTSDVIITPEGAVKVLGLGETLPRTLTPSSPPAAAYFLAPEQVRGEAPSESSDIYALGLVLYETATGVVSFEGPDAGIVAEKQLNAVAEPPRRVNPAVEASLEVVVLHALRKAPRDRYRNMDEFRQDLDRVADQIQGGVAASPDSEPGAKKSRRWVWIVLASALVLLLAAAGVGGWVWWRNNMAQVPTVVGTSPESARTRLAQAGLNVGSVAYSDKVAAGVNEGDVLSQDPSAGNWLRRGSKINLVINGPQKVLVPNVIGKPQADALAALQVSGLTIGAITQSFDATAVVGTVMSQTPTAGVEVPKATSVAFTVSKGPQSVSVPSVIGQTEAAATDALTKAGFKASSVRQSSDTVPTGQVISQAPTSGTPAKVGDSVTITVSQGPQAITVPSVVGQTLVSATDLIQAQRLIVKIVEKSSTAADVGKVIDQSPTSGTTAKPGDAVTITVGKL